MTSKQVQCEMCFKEQVDGYCNICGNICKTCLEIHKKGKAFKTHISKFYENNGDTSKSKMFDITEEICKKHPFEKTLFLCNTHDSIICGRCLHSDHLSCGNEVVDLCHEAGHFDFDKVDAMTAALNEIKDESKRLMETLDVQNNAQDVKCSKELDDLESKLKRKVEDTICRLRKEARRFSNENSAALSCISAVRDEKARWAIKDERQLNEFVQNSCTGHLYLMSRTFDKEILEIKRQMKEAEYKHTFKLFCLKENAGNLKRLLEYLTNVCEVQEEVVGSDDGATDSVWGVSQSTPKTSEGSKQDILHAKPSPDQSKMRSFSFKPFVLPQRPFTQIRPGHVTVTTQSPRSYELRKEERKERIRKLIQEERSLGLQQMGEDNRRPNEVPVHQSYPQHIYDQLIWNQPTGTLVVSSEKDRYIKLEFTFKDGIQMMCNPSPRTLYKGAVFTGHLRFECQMACRMLKEAFMRGLMFSFGENGRVELDGVSLYTLYSFEEKKVVKGNMDAAFLPLSSYKTYMQTLRAELASKDITEAGIDQKKELDEKLTFIYS